MEEKDADYFFGRERETVEVIKALVGAACAPAVVIPQSTTAAANVELKYVRMTSSFSALGKCLERALVPHALQSPFPHMVQSRKASAAGRRTSNYQRSVPL
jgi:hypothetical protein